MISWPSDEYAKPETAEANKRQTTRREDNIVESENPIRGAGCQWGGLPLVAGMIYSIAMNAAFESSIMIVRC